MGNKIRIYWHKTGTWVLVDKTHSARNPTVISCKRWSGIIAYLPRLKCCTKDCRQHRTRFTALCQKHEDEVQRMVRLRRRAREEGIEYEDLVAELNEVAS